MKFVISGLKTILLFCLLLFQLLAGQSEIISKTKLYNISDAKYISALEYAKMQNIRTIFYEDKEKLELRFQNVKIVLSPHSSFVRVNDQIYHMYIPVIYDGNDFFIPVDPFLKILNDSGLPVAFVDSSEKFVLSATPLYNVNGVSVVNKVNGAVLILKRQTDLQKMFWLLLLLGEDG